MIVSNLPRGCTWQDLKHFASKAGSVAFADVTENGSGFVEFFNRNDMEYAINYMDNTKFYGRFDKSIIRMKAAYKYSANGEDPRYTYETRIPSFKHSRVRFSEKATPNINPHIDGKRLHYKFTQFKYSILQYTHEFF